MNNIRIIPHTGLCPILKQECQIQVYYIPTTIHGSQEYFKDTFQCAQDCYSKQCSGKESCPIFEKASEKI